MIKHKPFLNSESRHKINTNYLADEASVVSMLAEIAENSSAVVYEIQFRASDLVETVRSSHKQQGTIEAFMHQYDLTSEEGTVLMCLAEALLRIPDAETADKLIKDKITTTKWRQHLGRSQSLFVNASTWGLMLSGKILQNYSDDKKPWEILSKVVNQLGEPIFRTVLKQAMRIMGSQFVMQTDINKAIERSKKHFHQNYRFSYDMLGEAALCKRDTERYFAAYFDALKRLGDSRKDYDNIYQAPSLSIKLSALHPRFEVSQYDSVIQNLLPKVKELALLAKSLDVAITVDAEEAERLDMTLDIFELVLTDKQLVGWNGFGLAVQAYQKRAYYVLNWLQLLAQECHIKIPLRLVKGAYWDTEIKQAQEKGLSDYPVFTRKVNTDIAYMACAKYLLQNAAYFYPQFATHNAYTIATIIELANTQNITAYEFQRLHGMGESLYRHIINDFPCRIYAPVGNYEDLLPYLVRRLLENGANTSFVHRIEDKKIPLHKIIEDPVEKLQRQNQMTNPHVPLPKNLFIATRKNSHGINLSDYQQLAKLSDEIKHTPKIWEAKPIIGKHECQNLTQSVMSPFNAILIGKIQFAAEADILQVLGEAEKNMVYWKNTAIQQRIEIIENFSVLLQQHATELYALCIYEAGKTLSDAIAELREAIDFCHYYIEQARTLFEKPVQLPGPTGEKNQLQLHGRGIFACISPWNFPLAIFTGQIVAAFISGNSIIAKPSSNTCLIGYFTIQLLLQAGASKKHIFYLPCKSSLFEAVILKDPRIAGVAFTGSVNVAWRINQTLASRRAAIAPLIAETGGQNVMIVDSSALAQQVVKDVITSAFYSAGQRCSALRVLIIQQDIEKDIIDLLINAMQQLIVGPPDNIESDVPPVINASAKQTLIDYQQKMTANKKLIYQLPIDPALVGHYVSPCVFKINQLAELETEQFGPFLHILSYQQSALADIVEGINALGYGLTLGIHSRIDETINLITNNVNIGNIYVNRNMIGAVVGAQPFGGEGLSGTGPKAGGPHYLPRFCVEKTVSINTSAVGGNAKLLGLSDS